MGLLDAIMQSGQRVKRNVRGLLDDPYGTTRRGLLNAVQDMQNYGDKTHAFLTEAGLKPMQGQAKPAPLTPEQKQALYNQTMNVVGFAPMGMIAYHGSPHKFNKFDMSKIGTGEGAQAYGHGLYFAEKPEVANSYITSPGGLFTVKGKTYGELQSQWGEFDKPTRRALSALADSQGNADEAIGNLKGMISPESNQAADVLKQWVDHGEVLKNTGNMYKVDIPDEAIPRMLDWDKPLSEQPDAANALSKILEKRNPSVARYMRESVGLDEAGKRALRQKLNVNIFDALDNVGAAYQATGDGPAVAAELKRMGIPGIRYLDQGSRTAGQGTHNYVLFDDQLPRILEINGQPTGLLPWKPGELKGSGNVVGSDPLGGATVKITNWPDWQKTYPNPADKAAMYQAWKKQAGDAVAGEANKLASMLDDLGIKPSFGGGLLEHKKAFPTFNSVNGVSSYMYVPKFGEVRFSDHIRGSGQSADRTFGTAEEALQKIKEHLGLLGKQ